MREPQNVQRTQKDPPSAKQRIAERQAQYLARNNPDLLRNQHSWYQPPTPLKTDPRKRRPPNAKSR